MKIQLINKKGLFAVIRSVLTIFFIYFTIGYIFGYMNSPITINNIDNTNQMKFKQVLYDNGVNYQNNITKISYQSILKNRFYVVQINNTLPDWQKSIMYRVSMRKKEWFTIDA